MAIDLVVTSDSEGQRLDRYLVSVLAEYSRSQIQKLIIEGHVTVRRSPARRVEARANLQVHEGDQVVVDAPEAAPSAVTAEALLHAADAAMYQVKDAGKNGVRAAG